MHSNIHRLKRQEDQIPKRAQQATLRAYKQALKAGLTITTVRRGEIVQVTKTPEGLQIVGTGKRIAPRRTVTKRRFVIPE